MKNLALLYWKEVRFLTWPAIALIVLFYSSSLLLLLEYTLQYVPSPLEFLFNPMDMLFSSSAFQIMFGLLFFYVLIHEHITKTRQQLFMLPIPRWYHLFCKITAVMTWVAIYVGILLVTWRLLASYQLRFPFGALLSPELMVIHDTGLFANSALVVALVAAGYVFSILFRRLQYLIGIMVMLAGYTIVLPLGAVSFNFLGRGFPWHPQTHVMVFPWFAVLFIAVMAILIIIPVLFVYEKYSEV